ncbi:MAG: mntP [Candidatus Eremiobacteraeota bacterium]|nr:mntP [Candidatus Eremiobacteraeota bacterium]
MGVAVVVSALALLPALAAAGIPLVDSTSVRTGGIALAVGLDVLALSTGIGVLGVPWHIRLRVGAAFAAAEIVMQILGAAIGTGAGDVVGEIAAYSGFVILALIGVWIFRESLGEDHGLTEKATSGLGLLAASASISLDSLGVGFSLPALNVPLVPLIGTVAITTVVFTFAGLRFGEILGKRFKQNAERGAGVVLVALAVLFTLQHLAH